MEFEDSYIEIIDSEFKRCFTLIDSYRDLCEKLIKENEELKRKNLELVEIIFKQQDDQNYNVTQVPINNTGDVQQ